MQLARARAFFGDRPELPGCHQAEPPAGQGDGEACIDERHAWISFQKDATGGQHARHPDG